MTSSVKLVGLSRQVTRPLPLCNIGVWKLSSFNPKQPAKRHSLVSDLFKIPYTSTLILAASIIGNGEDVGALESTAYDGSTPTASYGDGVAEAANLAIHQELCCRMDSLLLG